MMLVRTQQFFHHFLRASNYCELFMVQSKNVTAGFCNGRNTVGGALLYRTESEKPLLNLEFKADPISTFHDQKT